MATTEEQVVSDINHVRELFVECRNQGLATKADLDKLIPRVAELECRQVVHRLDSEGCHGTEEVLVQALETIAHSGPLSSTSTMLNEDDLEASPLGSSEVLQRAEIGIQFRLRRNSSSCSQSCSRSASPGSQCCSMGPLQHCKFQRREYSSRSPPPRGGSGTLRQQQDPSQTRERAGSPKLALEDGKNTIKLALLQAELLGQAELRSQNSARIPAHERQTVKRQQPHLQQQQQQQQQLSTPPCSPLQPPQTLQTPQTPRMTAVQPPQSSRTPPTGAKPSQQQQQPMQRQMPAGCRHNRQAPGQSPRARPSVPTSPILSSRR